MAANTVIQTDDATDKVSEKNEAGTDIPEKKESGADGKNNIGSCNADPNDLQKKIISQIEFYFGDANLPRDKFMLEQIKLDNGWIPMSTMLKFQRLSRLSNDVDVIIESVKHSQLVEVDSSGNEPKLRRSPEMPLPELNAERRKAILERTVYCKGFPLDADLDAVLAVINAHGSPENIYMRKYKDKQTQGYFFKGSIFATFKTQDEAKTFWEKEGIKIGEKDLIKMWQNDYLAMKKKESVAKEEARTQNLRAAKENDAKIFEEFKKGATIRLKGKFDEIARKDIQEALAELDIQASFINYNKGDKEAFVRLPKENSAKAAVEKMTDKFTVKSEVMVIDILEGEEEDAYLKQSGEDKKKFLTRSRKPNRGGGRRMRGGHKRHGGRHDRNDETPSKKIAV